MIGDAALTTGAGLGFELVDEVDDIEEAPAGTAADAGARDGDGGMILYRERKRIPGSCGCGEAIRSPGSADALRHGVALGDQRLGLGDGDFAALVVAEHIGLPAAHDAVDAVREPIGDGAERLLVMMPSGRHQAPVDLGEVGIDLSGGVGGEHEGALDAIVAALGDGLARPLGTAAVGPAGEQAAEAAKMALGVEAFGGEQDAEQDGSEVVADTLE
jgi:hypothetical protein